MAKKRNQKVSQLLNEILIEYVERNKNNSEGSAGDLMEASLLQSVADKLYEDAENLDILIAEMEP